MTVCVGCLSNRTLNPVTVEHLNLLNKLLQCSPRSKRQILQNNILLCWECVSFTRKIKLFRTRVLASQRILKHLDSNRNIEIQSLSSLKTETKANYDVTILYDKDYIKNEVKSERLDGDDDEYFNADHFDDNVKDDAENETKEDIKEATDCIPNVCKEEDDIKSKLKDIPKAIADTNNIDKLKALKEIIIKLIPINRTDFDTKSSGDFNPEIKDTVLPPKKVKSRKGQKQNQQYKTVEYKNLTKEKLHEHIERITVSYDQAKEIYNMQMENLNLKCAKLKSANLKCVQCLIQFTTLQDFINHQKYHDSVDGDQFYCDICNRGFKNYHRINVHLKSHLTAFKCRLCGDICSTQFIMVKHIRWHSTLFQCKKCSLTFEWIKEFYKHYREIHRTFKCDYCGLMKHSKKSIARHITAQHMDRYCKQCDVRFSNYRTWTTHIAMKHTKAESEDTYCVECDIQFPNPFKYKAHFRTFVRHIVPVKKEFPCPVCKKVYAKKKTMNYHYQYDHLKKTRFYCDPCERYFLDPCNLKRHKQSYHDKIPKVKNKICDICGRGFTSNRSLHNHRRMHTGERPFVCGYCPAAFAQKIAMHTHQKTQHKIYKGKPV